jgi:hypothetical protein
MTILTLGGAARWLAITVAEIWVADALANVPITNTMNPGTPITQSVPARETSEDRHANPTGNILQDDRADTNSFHVRDYAAVTS